MQLVLEKSSLTVCTIRIQEVITCLFVPDSYTFHFAGLIMKSRDDMLTADKSRITQNVDR